MSMGAPETVAERMKFIANRKPGESVSLPCIVLQGILAEITTLQGLLTMTEEQKIGHIQKLTMEMTIRGAVESIRLIAKEDWGNLTTEEVLLILATRLEETANKTELKTGGSS